MKIIVAHPGRQHSFRLASALKKANMLDCYVTTIYDKDSSKLMKVVKKFLSKDDKKRATNRKNPDLQDNEVVQFCRFRGLIEALLWRIDKRHKIYAKYRERTADKFGKKLAKLAMKRKVDAVICYDTNALRCFEILKKRAPQIKRILDVSIGVKPYMQQIFQKEFEFLNDKQKNFYSWSEKELNNSRQELGLTDYFLVASTFVKKSLTFCSVKPEKIYIVPYGANVSMSKKERQFNKESKLSILFVGQVNQRKGIPQLLEAVSRFDEGQLSLTIVGKYNENDWFIKKYEERKNIDFVGSVTFDRVKNYYENADVFVIDSFAEGMAQVGIEAMACGLPIICSENSGVNDLVQEEVNGFVIPCGNVQALQKKIQWFLENRDQIPLMGQEAAKTGKKYTWDYYEANVIKVIRDII